MLAHFVTCARDGNVLLKGAKAKIVCLAILVETCEDVLSQMGLVGRDQTDDFGGNMRRCVKLDGMRRRRMQRPLRRNPLS
jgi:hypothetical protein